MTMTTHLSHSQIERQLVDRVEDCMLKHGLGNFHDKRSGYSEDCYVKTEVTHEDKYLPSGKGSCRVDVEWKTPNDVYAFEVKRSKGDLKNWFTQKRDYNYLGMKPVVVLSKQLCYQIIPHQESALGCGYVAFDDRENIWYWGCSEAPPNIGKRFEHSDVVEYIPECPKCGCWVKCPDFVATCANCNWARSIEELESNNSTRKDSPYNVGSK